MHYYSKALPLALPLILAACGVASPDNPNAVVAVPTDQIPPEVLSISPADKAEVLPSIEKITVKFSEALAPALVEAASGLTVSPALPNMKIDYDSAASTAVVTWDKTTLPYNTDYTVTVNAALADLAGNKLKSGKTFSFRTPKAVKLKGTVTGLAPGQNITLTEKNYNASAGALKVLGESPIFSFHELVPSKSTYSVMVASQPSNRDYCSVLSGTATADDHDVTLEVVCGKVMPYFASAPNWNDYIVLDSSSNPMNPLDASGIACDATKNQICYHAGELRKAYVPDSLIGLGTTCADLTATDSLGWFNWTCVYDKNDPAGPFKMVTAKLKDNVNLSQLLSLSSAKWQSNKIILENTSSANKGIIENLVAAPWWNNPVIEATDGTLSQAGSVYVLRNRLITGEANTTAYQITADHIAAVTTGPLHPRSADAAIKVQSPFSLFLNYIWLEADLVAGNSNSGLALDHVGLAMVRNTSVSGAFGNGIALNTVYRSTFHNIDASMNFGRGIFVSGKSPGAATFGNIFNSVTVSGNGLSPDVQSTNGRQGIQISTQYNTLHNVRAINNKTDGILIGEALNVLSDATSYGNLGDGLKLDGASNSTVAGGTLVANGGAGLRLTNTSNLKTSSDNLFTNITSVLNAGDGVSISNSGNSLFRVVSALNGGNGLQAASPTTFVDNLVSGNSNDCNVSGVTVCPSGTSVASRNLTDTWTITTPSSTPNLPDRVAVKHEATLTGNVGAGPCETSCAELNLRLLNSDTLLRNKLAIPDAPGDVESHTYSGSTPTVFLAHAFELFGDRVGNDNGVCELNEACVYSPNLGAYQGEGPLLPIGTGAAGARQDLNVTLKQYTTNGN